MHGFGSLHAIWLVFLGSALLEVGGDAVVRKGLRASSILLIVAGGLMLAGYSLLVNLVRWDFSRLLGVYVAVFALVSALFGRFVFGESIPASTWIGLAVVMAGGMISSSDRRGRSDSAASGSFRRTIPGKRCYRRGLQTYAARLHRIKNQGMPSRPCFTTMSTLFPTRRLS